MQSIILRPVLGPAAVFPGTEVFFEGGAGGFQTVREAMAAIPTLIGKDALDSDIAVAGRQIDAAEFIPAKKTVQYFVAI